ncbi:MAG: hypothetical protein C9356_14640 [Oleiphilus sp.]|nr:MAG: hypothetical protein C9356_14640 [Oleiphilus sp.]
MLRHSGRKLDQILAKFALFALLSFCAVEMLSMLVLRQFPVALAFLPALLAGLGFLRSPSRFSNEIRLVVFLSLVWLAVLVSAYFNVPMAAGIALLLLTGFVVLRGQRSLWYSLIMLTLLCVVQVTVASTLEAYFSILRSNAYLFAMTLLAFTIAKRLLSARKEALNNSRSDVTTGTGNRSALVEELDELLEFYRRYKVEATAVSIRLPSLAQLLSEYGDPKIDQLLVELVNIWQTRIRNTDRLYRYGDDCFVLILPGTPVAAADSLLKDLQHASTAYEFTHVKEAQLAFHIETNIDHATWEDWLSALVRAPDNTLPANE